MNIGKGGELAPYEQGYCVSSYHPGELSSTCHHDLSWRQQGGRAFSVVASHLCDTPRMQQHLLCHHSLAVMFCGFSVCVFLFSSCHYYCLNVVILYVLDLCCNFILLLASLGLLL